MKCSIMRYSGLGKWSPIGHLADAGQFGPFKPQMLTKATNEVERHDGEIEIWRKLDLSNCIIPQYPNWDVGLLLEGTTFRPTLPTLETPHGFVIASTYEFKRKISQSSGFYSVTISAFAKDRSRSRRDMAEFVEPNGSKGIYNYINPSSTVCYKATTLIITS